MCGIAGVIDLRGRSIPRLEPWLNAMGSLLRHRGPDGHGTWCHPHRHVGLVHRRLSVIDLDGGAQPMGDESGNSLTYNGEVYNYLELRAEIGEGFRTKSDTEVLLRAYKKWGSGCLTRLRGMFSFALWDEEHSKLIAARDPFGIKPLVYAVVGDRLFFASEAKALLPFLRTVETDHDALKDYLTFQFVLEGRTLFQGVRELAPGHVLEVASGAVSTPRQYWRPLFEPDFDHTESYFVRRTRELIEESIDLNLRSDVPVGAYVSGGIDSSLVASLAARRSSTGPTSIAGFHGHFREPGFDESDHARAVAEHGNFPLHDVEIGAATFLDAIEKVIYHLDQPIAGPGAFPQFVVSGLVAKHRKVVLGGQGGDEVFGGYVRYLLAYFEQCVKAAINGTTSAGNFIVTYESIIPNLTALRNYQPLLQEFWREGLFEAMERRYFRLVNRANDLRDEIDWSAFGEYSPYDSFRAVFFGDNIKQESYFDRMTHFDFKTLLPALLHVEDRMSMAHGVEARVPLLDVRLVEFAATMPSNIKFENGALKNVLRKIARQTLPASVAARDDKMGFPVPLNDWVTEPQTPDAVRVREFVRDTLSTRAALGRDVIKNDVAVHSLDRQSKFGRKLWTLLSLELWQQRFHDRAREFRAAAEMEDNP